MEWKKWYEPPHDKKERVGVPTGLLNAERNEIISGDHIKLKDGRYDGIILWNRYQKCWGMYLGCWYLDKDPYNPDCYGQFIAIPADQGMRMELIPVDSEEV